ncbi:phosphonate C-P lyase system protein PhnL [Methylicorpusculum sp.]|uniref:phosphonate C-P lyase system protein PhnL n=1 Tax=Methylicorpusculum sp. TaxID=2713644 RepID=UPI002ABC78D3|nr:phosphonate C-P lyase system protein PhnL [Methylicorpusculum sp.]MDZ4152978.1 phosphonate C-P lyase system protein PhnL [Methylicorpusculum sp.]
MTRKPLLSVENLSKTFYLHEQNKVIPSSSQVNLTVYSGKLTALIGPTGAGKSSVLKSIYRTYLPSSGRLLYETAAGGTLDLALALEHRILELRRDEIGFVTQFLHTLPRQKTLDVVAMPLYQQGVNKQEGRARAAELLAELNIPERLWEVPPATFSGGEKQRVNLARGLIASPRLLLLDEPTASLDAKTTDRVVALIQRKKEQGVGMLAIFHHADLVKRMADEVVELSVPVANDCPTLE